jgi:hypothetical protein
VPWAEPDGDWVAACEGDEVPELESFLFFDFVVSFARERTLCLKPFIMDCDMRGYARQAKRMSSAQSRGMRCSAAGGSSVKGLGLR